MDGGRAPSGRDGGGGKKSSGGLWGIFRKVLDHVSIDLNLGASVPAPRAPTGNPADRAARMEPVRQDRKETYDEMMYRTTDGEQGKAWSPSGDLERELMRAVSAQAQRGDGKALAFAYTEVLRPNKAMPFIGALTASDPVWVATHAEQIVRATPTAAKAILFNLRGLAIDVGDVGVRIAPIAAHADPTFADDLDSYVPDQKTRERILSAGGTP